MRRGRQEDLPWGGHGYIPASKTAEKGKQSHFSSFVFRTTWLWPS